MNVPKVSISLANGQIGGAPATADRVVGLIGTGSGTGVALLTPFVVYSLNDAIDQGFTEAAEPEIYRHIKEFYDVAPLNSKLYLMAVANTVSLEELADKTNANGAKKLLDFANGEIQGGLGIVRKPDVSYVPAAPQFIDSDAIEALPNGKTLVQEYFNKHMPFRLLIGARVVDDESATIFQPSSQNNNGVALVTGGTQDDGSVSMGLFLGKIAATAPHRNIGALADGSLPVNNIYIGTKKLREFAGINTLIENGFMTFQTYPKVDGFFVSDDPMCAPPTDDYCYLTNCRVIDKASIIAYQTYVLELKSEVDLSEAGEINPADLKYLEAVVKNNIALGAGESISKNSSNEPIISVFINPAQNLSIPGKKLAVKLRVKPKGYLREIDVELGFN